MPLGNSAKTFYSEKCVFSHSHKIFFEGKYLANTRAAGSAGVFAQSHLLFRAGGVEGE
jgi:hypothetical protein